MAVVRGFLGFTAACRDFCVLVVLVLVVQPHQANGLGRALTAPSKDVVKPPVAGICAASVIVHGYKCQELNVTTKDGYILSLQRIPEGRVVQNGGNKRQPVLLQHGVLMDGMSWLLNSPEHNLPMILADNGFDVWISNTRGTRFSRQHTSQLDSSTTDFWNWSWDELVSFDMPAVIDFVCGQTGQKINYVGHSQGTLIALASLSEGKLVKQMKSVTLLSPVAYLRNMNSALGKVAAKAFVGEIGTTYRGYAEFNPKKVEVGNFLKSLCAYSGVDCYDMLSGFTGKNCCLNSSSFDLFLANEAQSTSNKNMVHFSQTFRDGTLAKYDYVRPSYNVMHYGQVTPPIYNLSNIPHDLPLFLSYGGQDALSDVQDVKLLLGNLKVHDVDKLSVQFIKEYAHLDFIMGLNAKDKVYNQVVAFFKRQNS
ncbi:triacylglycerol lipase 2-like [Juglans microcarpa x Juglans regia]|uniref:triacylglycerol lipase 2-like n=1 Tax=Juglans microcarpa x Juglans regia TaxID=2249226 RepID=UPI001B7E4379|nr:triacylglycerol lipase 2-like [Juglans microcarpa x Juglans regia]